MVHRGRGLWKFNVSHLNNDAFIQMVSHFWQTWRLEKTSFLCLSAWWDAGKSRLRSKIRAFSRAIAASICQRIRSLENTLVHLNRHLQAGEDVADLLSDTKASLAAAHKQQARGARMRAQVQWAEEREA